MLKVGRRVGAAALLAISGLSLISTQAQAQLGLGSLIVAMTSPASGSIVSDTVPVRASVSVIGLITVRGVQFQLDGANLGAEDTTAPYSVPWDTTTATAGSHTLSAVARDTSNNTGTAAAVNVTVVAGGAGDLFVALVDGSVQWRGPDGTLRQTLPFYSDGQAS